LIGGFHQCRAAIEIRGLHDALLFRKLHYGALHPAANTVHLDASNSHGLHVDLQCETIVTSVLLQPPIGIEV
jgi:hypothetical protein